VTVLVKVTIILLAALIAVRLARRSRASVRHAILAATFAVLVALPLANAVLPAMEIAMLPRAAGSGPSAGIRDRLTPADGAGERETGQQVNAAPGALPTRVAAVSLTTAALSIWLTGAALVLLSLALGLFRVHQLRRSALPSLGTRPFLSALANAAGVRQAVDVVVHEDIRAPFTCGLMRPVVVLPSDAHEWPPSALSRALIHELEHVKRCDWAVQVLARAVCALYWFHPLVWIAYRQLCLQAEHACDDAVVVQEEDTVYADQLVTLARRLAARPTVAVLGMAERSDLAARVSAVLDPSRARGPAGLMRATAVAATALALLATLAPLQVVAETGNSAIEAEARLQDGALAAEGRDMNGQRRLRSSRLDRALVEAADEGNLREVGELLEAGANVNAAVAGDGSPLIAAARNGHAEIVRLLLDRGADANLTVAGDGAALIMAAREGHVDVVQLLLDRGAVVDLMVTSDENALIQASGAGHLEVVRLLVVRGADVNARIWVEPVFNRPGGEWRTPLNMAIKGGHRDVVAFLRASGAVE
jgi:beta-lactamase regulating signal transducer with metallopeptidase domain